MIQTKLDVLSKVGLGNENFLDKDTENVQHKARLVMTSGVEYSIMI
jgi:hypothetical protein